MRPFRYAIGAALGALALVVTIPTSANAAVGEFTYQYGDVVRGLTNPANDVCHKIANDDQAPGTEPLLNATNMYAHLYTDDECLDYQAVIPPVRGTIDYALFHSVKFTNFPNEP
ncbi:hypothetical protein GCM10010252_07220 [Streptomyces aureoverticillatus]|nr:hypothetical protein GCM10010252_07220 [Streptomyces aureoverticillatus]